MERRFPSKIPPTPNNRQYNIYKPLSNTNLMSTEVTESNAHTVWDNVLSLALKLPTIKVDRYGFLAAELHAYCKPDQLPAAIACPPAVIPMEVLHKIAKSVIAHHRNWVSALSFTTGLPGGPALLGTLPADMAQYYAHTLSMVQKLSYLYGYADITQQGRVTERTRQQLTVMLGVAFGVEAAQKAVATVATKVSKQVAQRLPRVALTKTIYYPIVKEVAKWLGINLTKGTFAKSLSKVIPVVGGFINGGMSWFTFKALAKNFHKYMKEHPIMHAYVEEETEYIEVESQE